MCTSLLQQTDSPSLLARLLVMTTQDASIFSSDDVLLTAALLDSIIVSVSDISMEQVSQNLSHTDMDRISSLWLLPIYIITFNIGTSGDVHTSVGIAGVCCYMHMQTVY